MAKIKGLENIQTGAQLQQELAAGGKFVVYSYVVSVLILTFRRSSDIYFVRGGESRVTPGLGFSLLSLAIGWWGFPWGIIYTPMALWTNFNGGKDVTNEVLASMRSSQA